MKGIHAFGLSALATSRPDSHRPSQALPQLQQQLQHKTDPVAPFCDRRDAFRALFQGGVATALVSSSPSFANALDMDAFMNAELEADKKNCDPKKDPKCVPKLSADEALCKYGQSGNARSEACKRVRTAGGDLPDTSKQGKSLGGAYAI